jgi:hypothetical protein
MSGQYGDDLMSALKRWLNSGQDDTTLLDGLEELDDLPIDRSGRDEGINLQRCQTGDTGGQCQRSILNVTARRRSWIQ